VKRIILTESQYKRLVNQPLNEEDTDFDIELEGNIVRRWNNNNPEHVERVQKMLKYLGYDLGPYGENDDGVDGIYGSFTEKAVEEFQENEMPDQPYQWDGIIGPITYEILKNMVKVKVSQEGGEIDDLLDLDDIEGDEYEDDGLLDMVTNNFECIPAKWAPIFDLINLAESRRKGYDSLYPNTSVSEKYKSKLGGKHPTEMTFKEIAEIIGKGGYNTKNPAVGMWQFTSLLKQAKKAGFNGNDLFSKCNQDEMAMYLMIRKRKVTLDLIKNNPTQAGNNIAMEWAGMPVLSTFKDNRGLHKRGESYYEGSINSSNINPKKVESTFKKMVGNYGESKITKTGEYCKFRVDGNYVSFDDLTPDPNMGGKGYGLNFHKIPDGENNFRSAAPSAEQMLFLLENNNIKNIISFDDGNGGDEMSDKEEKKFIKCYNKSNGTNIKWNHISAHQEFIPKRGYVGTLNDVLPLENNTLIHCTHGADRTGYVVAKHLEETGSWTKEELWDYTVKYNGWEGKGGYICKGDNYGYIKYLEGFYPHSEWCAVGNRRNNCRSCKNIS